MGKITRDFECDELWRLKNASDISKIVVQSQNFPHATELLASYFAEMDCNLLFVGGYDPEAELPCRVVLSNFPESLTKMCACFDDRKGCPLVQFALKSGKPFEALSLYLSGFDDFSSMRYLKELQHLGYDQIGIVPIVTDEQVFVFFVGIDNLQFQDQIQARFNAVIGQFIAAVSTKYHIGNFLSDCDLQTGDSMENVPEITKHQKDCLLWMAQGKTVHEVSVNLGLSEHTVNICLRSACKRLGATTRSHAIAKAIQLGIID